MIKLVIENSAMVIVGENVKKHKHQNIIDKYSKDYTKDLFYGDDGKIYRKN